MSDDSVDINTLFQERIIERDPVYGGMWPHHEDLDGSEIPENDPSDPAAVGQDDPFSGLPNEPEIDDILSGSCGGGGGDVYHFGEEQQEVPKTQWGLRGWVTNLDTFWTFFKIAYTVIGLVIHKTRTWSTGYMSKTGERRRWLAPSLDADGRIIGFHCEICHQDDEPKLCKVDHPDDDYRHDNAITTFVRHSKSTQHQRMLNNIKSFGDLCIDGINHSVYKGLTYAFWMGIWTITRIQSAASFEGALMLTEKHLKYLTRVGVRSSKKFLCSVRLIAAQIMLENVTKELESCREFGITLDTRGSLLAVRATFIRKAADGSHHLTQRSLGFSHLQYRETGLEVAVALQRLLPPRLIREKCSYVIGDGAGSVNIATELLNIQEQSWCCPHRLNLALKNSALVCDEITKVRTVLHNIALYFKDDNRAPVYVAAFSQILDEKAPAFSKFLTIRQRWNCNLTPMRTIMENYRTMLSLLGTYAANHKDGDKRSRARERMKSLDFENLFWCAVNADCCQLVDTILRTCECSFTDMWEGYRGVRRAVWVLDGLLTNVEKYEFEQCIGETYVDKFVHAVGEDPIVISTAVGAGQRSFDYCLQLPPKEVFQELVRRAKTYIRDLQAKLVEFFPESDLIQSFADVFDLSRLIRKRDIKRALLTLSNAYLTSDLQLRINEIVELRRVARDVYNSLEECVKNGQKSVRCSSRMAWTAVMGDLENDMREFSGNRDEEKPWQEEFLWILNRFAIQENASASVERDFSRYVRCLKVLGPAVKRGISLVASMIVILNAGADGYIGNMKWRDLVQQCVAKYLVSKKYWVQKGAEKEHKIPEPKIVEKRKRPGHQPPKKNVYRDLLKEADAERLPDYLAVASAAGKTKIDSKIQMFQYAQQLLVSPSRNAAAVDPHTDFHKVMGVLTRALMVIVRKGSKVVDFNVLTRACVRTERTVWEELKERPDAFNERCRELIAQWTAASNRDKTAFMTSVKVLAHAEDQRAMKLFSMYSKQDMMRPIKTKKSDALSSLKKRRKITKAHAKKMSESVVTGAAAAAPAARASAASQRTSIDLTKGNKNAQKGATKTTPDKSSESAGAPAAKTAPRKRALPKATKKVSEFMSFDPLDDVTAEELAKIAKMEQDEAASMGSRGLTGTRAAGSRDVVHVASEARPIDIDETPNTNTKRKKRYEDTPRVQTRASKKRNGQ